MARYGPGQLTRPALSGADLDRVRNRAVLYVHLPIEALFSPEAPGVARVEDIGPILTSQLRDWLRHSHLTVKPVLDPTVEPPADSYEIPPRLREAIHLTSPTAHRDIPSTAGGRSRRPRRRA